MRWPSLLRRKATKFEDRALVRDDAVLYVEGFAEPVYLLQLRRIIANSVRNLDGFNKWLETLPPIQDHPGSTGRAAAYNYLERTRESLRVLSEIMNCNVVYSPIQHAAHELAILRDAREREKLDG